jgi:hypothetical protein
LREIRNGENHLRKVHASDSHCVLVGLFGLLLQRVHARHDVHLRGWRRRAGRRRRRYRLHLLLLKNVQLRQHHCLAVLVLRHVGNVFEHLRQCRLVILMLMHSVCVHCHDGNELVANRAVFDYIELGILAVD